MRKLIIFILILVLGTSLQLIKPVFSLGTDEVALEEPASEEAHPLIIKGARPLIDPFALRIAVRRIAEMEAKPAGPTPPGAPGATVTPPKPKRIIKLEGIWIDATMRVAFISGQALVEGGRVMGWKVAQITRDRVVLVRDGQTKILTLEGIR